MNRPGIVSVVYPRSAVEHLCERCHSEGKATLVALNFPVGNTLSHSALDVSTCKSS